MESKLFNPIAVCREGNTFLLAQKADIQAGNKNGKGQSHNVDTGKFSPIQSLQVFFKWANWEDCTDADYQEALKAAKQ